MRVLLCLIALGCATKPALAPQKFTPQPAELAPANRVRAAELAPALAELETTLRDAFARKKYPSLAVGVVTDEGLV